MGSDFDHEYQELLQALEDGIRFLRAWHQDFWADWLTTDEARIQRGDYYGLDHLLQAFGGMGSLTDLLIHRVNGDPVSDEDAPAVNQQLNELRHRIWLHAKTVRQEIRER